MSRPLLIEFPGAVHHVMNRGLNRNLAFLENKDHELFGETLGLAGPRPVGIELPKDRFIKN